jgi:N-glycosidase YbiA
MIMRTNHPHEPCEIDPRRASPSRWRRARWDEPGTIYFWSARGGPFAAFSNFAPTPFEMPAWHDPAWIVPFATAEHAFQAAKARTANEHEQIRRAATPLGAKRAGRRVALPAGWDRRRAHVMLAVVRAKFAVPELTQLLLATGERILAEDSPYDPVWGCRDRAGGYTGQNLLGRALMRVRDELRQTGAPPPTP